MDSPNNFKAYLGALTGLALTRISNDLEMCIVHFGDLRPDTNHRGESVQLPEWALHLQCPWHFIRNGKTVLGRADLVSDARTPGPFPNDTVQDDRYLVNRDRLHRWMVSRPVKVESIACGQTGSFDLKFSRGLRLNVAPEPGQSSEVNEDWRLFRPGRDSDTFVYPVKPGASTDIKKGPDQRSGPCVQ